MAERESINLWSTTALTNAAIDPSINFAEGQLPGTLNNSNRAGMAAVARWKKDNDGSLTTAGSANAYTLTINQTYTAYANGHRLSFKASFSNTGPATINVTNADATALGAKAIRAPGDVALTPGQMISGGRYDVQWDAAANGAAGAFVLLNPNPSVDWTFLQNYLSGLGTAYASTTTFTVAAGVAADSTNVVGIKLSSAITKSTSAWAVGSGNGGLDTGSIANATQYHAWLIQRSDTGVVDVLFSASASAPTMPTSYDRKRRIFSFPKTDGSAHFVKWIQDGDDVTLDVPVNDVSAANPGTSAVTRTLSVPTGIRVKAYMTVGVVAVTGSTDSPNGVYLSDLSVTDTAANFPNAFVFGLFNNNAALTDAASTCSVYTNTSGQIRSRLYASAAGTTLYITTLGWTDTRGRDG